MTSFTLRSGNAAKTRVDAIVVGLLSGPDGAEIAPGGAEVAAAYGRRLRPLLSSLGLSGKAGEVAKVPTSGAVNSPLLILVGLGADADPGAVRRGAGVAARAVSNAASVALALPCDTPELLRAATEGWALGSYAFTSYKSGRSGAAGTAGKTGRTGRSSRSDDAEDGKPVELIVLSDGARRKDMTTAFTEAQVVAEAVATTRDWVNVPPGDLTPPLFADAVVAAHKSLTSGRGAPKVSITVHDEVALAELGCGGILGVGQGSSAPPRLVEIGYHPKGATTHLALVGKGITFDSGGLSIKPGASMTTMKCDMAGAASVVQATFAIARLGLPVRVSTFVPMAENMVGGDSYRPGDVLRLYGGTTVEIANTDAEGRLVLGDALVRATEVQPDLVVDVATLTGAMVVALGERIAGVLGSPEIVDQVLAAGRVAGEELWPMPIPAAMDERIHGSKIADLAQHDWIRWGGGLFAAAFLREFTAGLPWAHLDIAGPAFNPGGPWGHTSSGGTGFSVATLVDLARSLA